MQLNDKYCQYGFDTARIKMLDFDSRRQWFLAQLDRSVDMNNHLDVAVSRETVFEDSLACIGAQDKSRLQCPLKVVFEGETKLLNDASGIKKSWMEMLKDHIFGEATGLFEYDPLDESYKIDRTSRFKLSKFEAKGKKYNHLELMTFAGRMMGKILFEGERLPVHLTPNIYKSLLQQEVTLEDVRHISEQLFLKLNGVRNGEQDYHPDLLCQVFGATEMEPGTDGELTQTEVEIGRIGGLSVDMSMDNRVDWVEYQFHWALRGRIKDELERLLMGFWSVVNPKLISVFSWQELQMIMCGNMELDTADWEANTKYEGGYSTEHPAVKWFWEVVNELTEPDRIKMLQFVTGSQSVPIEGFKGLADRSGLFTLKKVKHGTKATGGQSMPIGHTCANTLDLPAVSDKATLAHMVRLCVDMGMESQFIME
eukprot:TRINITY_DN3138_c0_g1_i1.p1 TRINITY_DN3138_c0_g1~~TRINITY_DN3138_c0_g1_i1.p1  ORF type:complete len:425 (-),score=131.78 TRINITY_DN3138_c0_g1_i1:256-1530(-)